MSDNINAGSLATLADAITPSASDQLAPELWLSIFSHIPRNNIPTLTLTCQSFRSLAQPLLFDNLALSLTQRIAGNCLYGFDYSIPKLFLYGSLKNHIDRLAFYASDRIAPSIRSIRVDITLPYLDETKGVRMEEGGDALIEEFFEVLPRFTGLKSLRLSHIDFSARRLTQLAKLTCLPVLSLTIFHSMISAHPEQQLPLVGISDFKMDDHVLDPFTRLQTDEDLARWTTFVHPKRLRSLRLLRDYRFAEALLPSLSREPFENLRILHIPYGITASPYFLAAFSQFTGLKELLISRMPPSPSTDPLEIPVGFVASTLPQLEKYGGPEVFLDIFPAGHHASTLCELTLWGSLSDGSSDPDTTVSCLERLFGVGPLYPKLVELPNVLGSLHLVVRDLTEELFLFVCRNAKSLEDLCITSFTHSEYGSKGIYGRQSLLAAATREIPASIQTLTIQTCFGLPSVERVVREVTLLTGHLTEQRGLKNLQTVQLSFDDYWACWNARGAGGEATTGVLRLRKRFGKQNELEVSLFHNH
ncbi:hypothetical protein JAAARDRAFT_428182 [Jaapia argillacea MUCL 33604]|uniref:F-box domain-containing protein n=1 Tax=Jaapia argillacea MUCL 33604 TaxID=933084 RepID=A0A067PI95_9AGAM|nr:hypothetical protein JAAARDRAFT_428182 [Jaapia argillacea MUCL 33604]